MVDNVKAGEETNIIRISKFYLIKKIPENRKKQQNKQKWVS